MQPQTIPQSEIDATELSHFPNSVKSNSSKLSVDKFKLVFRQRQVMLDSIKNLVSLKFFAALESKLKAEQELALELTNSNYLASKRQSQYSHVLDAQYFEQRLL